MGSRVWLPAVAVVLLRSVDAGAGGTAHLLEPSSHGGAITVDVGGKPSVYHLGTAAEPLAFEVEGPCRLRVLSRCVFGQSPPGDSVPYELRVEIDGIVDRVLSEHARVSTQASLADGSKIGTLERATAPVPAGKHVVRISPTSGQVSVALRVLRTQAKPKPTKWIPFAPESFQSAVRLQSRDTESTYYRFDIREPVAVTIQGPLRLKFLTRLDFGTERGYTQAYVVKVFLDGEPWKNFSLTSSASHTAIYPELPEITPGVGRDFTVSVPAGAHEVKIFLDCTTANAASLRIVVPERELLLGLR
jgi:hypothetical protein